MTVKWQRFLSWAVLLALIVGGLIYGFQPQPRLVDVATVHRAPLRVSIEQEGKTRVIARYVISAPVAGTTCRRARRRNWPRGNMPG